MYAMFFYLYTFNFLLSYLLHYLRNKLVTRTKHYARIVGADSHQTASDSHRSSTAVPGRHCSVSNYQQSQTSEIVRNNGLRQTNDKNEVR